MPRPGRFGPPSTLAPLALALLLAAGCASGLQSLPPAPPSDAVAANALRRAQESYLYPDRLDRRVMIGALDALETRFDAVRFEADDDADFGTLTVGEQAARVPLDEPLDPERFDMVLGQALAFVAAGLGDEANRDEASDLELIALQGALAALDRYCTVFSGRATEDFQIRFSGKLRGIGARIGRRDGHLTAVRVFTDSPASRAGMQDGDAILAIDGNSTRPLTVGEAVEQIRGPAGTHVVLTVLRADDELELDITRGEVTVPSVETRELAPGIGYARISNMSRTTATEFRDKVRELGPLEGLALDLRGNTGGSMMAAAQLADQFLESGVIVRIVDREGDSLGTRSRAIAKPGVVVGGRIVILVDPSTASAAEILSGAISPLARVTLVGQTTFGKGLIQRVMPLPDQRLLKLTVGEYLLSEDRAIHERGIDPDLVLYPVSTDDLGRLARVPDAGIPYLRKAGEDDAFPTELAAALLEDGDTGLALERARADAAIREALAERGVSWSESPLPGELAPLVIETTSESLVAGHENRLRIRLHNPNDFPIPDVWATLEGPAEYLRNHLAVIGTLPPGGSGEAELILEPGEGLSADELPVELLIAAGRRALQAEPLVLAQEHRTPELEIEVARIDESSVRVTLHNRGCCDPGALRVAVLGAVRSMEQLLPGQPETVELPLTGGAETVSVLLVGAGVQQRIDVPLPEHSVRVVPPALRLARGTNGWSGSRRVEVHARSTEGLREGWLALDGQKEVYVAWHGQSDGRLWAEFGPTGGANLMTKIETTSGVSVIDSRQLTAD